MPRDLKTVSVRDPVTQPPLVPATPPSRSEVRKTSVMLFDPYSQQIFAYTKPGDVATIQGSPPVHGAAGGASKALRVLQLALLSSVAVMIWFMLSLLKVT